MRLPSNEIKKIVVFRALQLGDTLCSIPAFRALRMAYPGAEITLISLPWAKFVIERFTNYFDHLIVFPGYPGFPEQDPDFKVFPSFLSGIQMNEFDLAIQMQGNGVLSNALVKLFNAKHTAGFYKAGNYCPDYDLFIEYPSNFSEIERHLTLMKHLGLEEQGKHLEFPITAEDEAELKQLSFPIETGKYVVIHPGSRGIGRRWSPENFASLADYCVSKGLKIVITGTNDELPIVENVAEQMKTRPIIAAGRTSLGAVGFLIKHAYALISNCTGVSHMASALKTPSVVISLDGEPDRWASLNKLIHKTIDWTTTPDYNLALKEVEKLVSYRG
jgi:ADP-heptose:LPS heptosyltransferase